MSDGKTVVVPASDVPSATTATCASGWFMCGSDGGARVGCCPSGYDCGTASCFTVSASQTGSVQKQQPKKDAAVERRANVKLSLAVALASVVCGMMMV